MVIDMRKIPEIITARLTESGISIPKEREIVQMSYGGYSSSVDISLDLPSELKVNMATEPKLYSSLKDNVAEKNEVSQMKAITSTTKYTPRKTEPSRRGVRNVKRPASTTKETAKKNEVSQMKAITSTTKYTPRKTEPSRRGVRNVKRPASTTKETAKKNETSSIAQLSPITFDAGYGLTATLSESGIDLSPKPQYTVQATSEGLDLVPTPMYQVELNPEGINLQAYGTPTQYPTVPIWAGTESYSAPQIVEQQINQPTAQTAQTAQTAPQVAVEGAPVVYQYTVPYYIPVESQADLTELATAGDSGGNEATTWDKIKAWLEENWHILLIVIVGIIGLIVALKGKKKKR